MHVAFTVDTRGAVDIFYAAALAAGATPRQAPAIHTQYHDDYYGGFVNDPHGINLEAVCHPSRDGSPTEQPKDLLSMSDGRPRAGIETLGHARKSLFDELGERPAAECADGCAEICQRRVPATRRAGMTCRRSSASVVRRHGASASEDQQQNDSGDDGRPRKARPERVPRRGSEAPVGQHRDAPAHTVHLGRVEVHDQQARCRTE